MQGLSFCRCEYSPFVKIFMNNFYDTVKIWLENDFPQYIKVKDYRDADFGVGAHVKFFEPNKEYYKVVRLKPIDVIDPSGKSILQSIL